MKLINIVIFIAGLAIGIFVTKTFFPTEIINTVTIKEPPQQPVTVDERIEAPIARETNPTSEIPTQEAKQEECAPKIEKVRELYCPEDEKSAILSPPQFTADASAIFRTNKAGEVKISWKPVRSATAYRIKVFNNRHEAILTRKTPGTSLYLKEIPFNPDLEITTYRIALVTINNKDEEGPEGEMRVLEVNRLNSIIAPKIEGITIED